jgi:hypothetical protein
MDGCLLAVITVYNRAEGRDSLREGGSMLGMIRWNCGIDKNMSEAKWCFGIQFRLIGMEQS